MIGMTHSGAGFGGVTRYLLQGEKDHPNPDRVLWTSTRELILEDPQQAAFIMRATAAQGRTDKPVQHLSISLPPDEHLTREQWEQVIDTTLRDLGLDGHQALIVAHRDTAHDHIHLLVNRVHPDTLRAWDRWQDRPRLMTSLRSQELALGLRATPHVEDPNRLPPSVVRQFERTGEPPLLDYARAVARPVFQEARSWSELHERLAEQGLYLERKGQGLVVTDDQRHVKASSVDRSASLRALEGRLGPYEQRRLLLQDVDSDLRGDRRSELAVQVAPVHAARQEVTAAMADRHNAGRRLEETLDGIRSAIASAYHEAPKVETRYLGHLNQEKTLPQVLPAQLGDLKGAVLHAGRTYVPLGAEGRRAFDVAANQLPRLGTAYLRAQDDLARADAHLADARQKEAQLTQRLRPHLEELDQIDKRAASLYERTLALRPRDQIALARVHGSDVLERAAKRRPEPATRTAASRQSWLQNPSRDLNRALDRRLSRAAVPPQAGHQSHADWMMQAFRLGLHPLHAIQALTRGGLPVADAVQAVALTRAALRNPVKTGVLLTAKAMGLPALPLRLAVMAWTLARTMDRVLSR
jgi:hypothetical protein